MQYPNEECIYSVEKKNCPNQSVSTENRPFPLSTDCAITALCFLSARTLTFTISEKSEPCSALDVSSLFLFVVLFMVLPYSRGLAVIRPGCDERNLTRNAVNHSSLCMSPFVFLLPQVITLSKTHSAAFIAASTWEHISHVCISRE